MPRALLVCTRTAMNSHWSGSGIPALRKAVVSESRKSQGQQLAAPCLAGVTARGLVHTWQAAGRWAGSSVLSGKAPTVCHARRGHRVEQLPAPRPSISRGNGS